MTTFDSDYAYNMATQLAGYDTQNRYARLDAKKTGYQNQLKAYTTLSSAVSAFKSKVSSLNSVTSPLLQNKATLSSEGYATATVGSKAAAGSYQFFVKQLASKDQVALQGLKDADLTGSGTLTIGQGGGAGFAVDMSGVTTLEALAGKINDASGNSGVTATLVRSNGSVNLMLTSDETGVAQKITTLSLTGASAEFETALANKKQLSEAKDAEVYLGADEANGILLTNKSNTFDNIIDDVSLTFTKPHQVGDAPLTVTVAQDPSATKAKMEEFISAYNALVTSIKSLTASGSEETERGALAGDGTMRSIKSLVDGLIRAEFPAGSGLSLVSLGVSADRNGQLTLNSDRFEKMLAETPEALEGVLKGKGNLLDSLDKGLAAYTNTTSGVLTKRKEALNLSLKQVSIDTEKVDQRYETLHQRYLKQFTNMMTMMSSMDTTASLYFS